MYRVHEFFQLISLCRLEQPGLLVPPIVVQSSHGIGKAKLMPVRMELVDEERKKELNNIEKSDYFERSRVRCDCRGNEPGEPSHLVHAFKVSETCREFTQDSTVLCRAIASVSKVGTSVRGSSDAVRSVARGGR